MSAEHHNPHHERHEQASVELEATRQEKLQELRETGETIQDNPDTRAEAAREMLEHATKQESAPKPEPTPEPAPKSPVHHLLDHKLNYRQTMASVQRRLTPVSRSFSKIIHTPTIEKTSEALEKTVARPSIMLGATWTALLVGSVFYFTARHFGYSLSGSEMLFSLLVGAGLGIVLEGLFRSLKRRH